MNRKQRREMMRKMQSEDRSLEVVHPHAAGSDMVLVKKVVSRERCRGALPRTPGFNALVPSR